MADLTPRQAALNDNVATLRTFNAHMVRCTLCRVAQRPHNTTRLCAEGTALHKVIRATAKQYAKGRR